ncbi:MAG: alpha-D-ribose 1-methylphosphonate 5-triphosphate diphosphatase [Pseudomonadota bacterium]
MPDKIISNARIILADEVVEGNIRISDGLIADLGSGATTVPSLDFEGDYLIPGLVELHTDNLERHVMPRPKSYWPTESAVINHDREVASAGITTVFDALSVGYLEKGSRGPEAIRELAGAIGGLQAKGALKVDHFIHWRCEVSGDHTFADTEELCQNPATGLISVMDHTPGQRQFVSLEAYHTYYQGKYGLTDEQMKEFIHERKDAQLRNSARNRRSIVALAHSLNIPLASHDDATVEHVAEAIEDGIVVSEFPTTLAAARAGHANSLSVLMGAPNVVRGKSHSGNVSARELANEGVLDILSSDYVPFSLLYGATLLARHCESISLPQAIATVTRNPAEQIGLLDRGEISIGKRADLVRFRMDGDVPAIVEVWRGGERIG